MESSTTAKSPAAPRKKRTFYVSLRVRLLIIFTLLFSVIFGAAYYWFYAYSTQTAQARIQDELKGVLEGGSTQINGDDLAGLAKDGKPNPDGFTSDDPRYKTLLSELDLIHSLQPQAWPYLYVKGAKDKEVTYVVDLWQKYDTSKAAGFLETDPAKRPFILMGFDKFVLNNNDDGSFRVYKDQYGSWTSAYGPVKDALDGKVGALGIDFKADYVNEVQQGIIKSTGIAFLATYVTLFISVYIVSSALTRPVIALRKTAQRIGNGNYDVDMGSLIDSRFKDEIVTLAEVFQVMVGKVYQREQVLVRKVESLQIEIDTAKRQKQVSEIVETDFFKELQEKAKLMRTRHNQPVHPMATSETDASISPVVETQGEKSAEGGTGAAPQAS